MMTMFSYVHQFPSYCTSWLGTGLSFSGIVMSLLGNFQKPGPSEEMRFSFRGKSLYPRSDRLIDIERK